jgi:type II secretion system (T2SS) protein M
MSLAALPTGRQGQLLALALLLAALGTIYLFAAAPLLELYTERSAAVENARLLVPRLKAAADELPGLRARAAEPRATASTHKVTRDGSSDAIASANLQSHIAELATSAGVTIGSTESLPTETRGGYRRIGLRYALNGPYETLMKFLATLDAATPPLVVDNLSIHGVMRRPGTPAASALDAGLDVYGFRNNENLAAAKP